MWRDIPLNAEWTFERSMVIFQDCNVTKNIGLRDWMSKSTVILIDSIYRPSTLQIESSKVNMTRSYISSVGNLGINETTMFLTNSVIAVYHRNRFLSISNSVMSLHSSGLSTEVDDPTWGAHIQFVNTNATFIGPMRWAQRGGSIMSSSGVSFVDSWVNFPICTSLDQVINRADGQVLTSKGGRVWCVSNTTLRAEAAPTGKYTASVPFILTMTLNFNDDGTMDFDNDVKVAHQEINCPKTKVAITDAAVTFPNIGNTGDCMGDALRGQKKDVTKFKVDINSDGTLTFHSDGWPDLKLKKASASILV